MTSLYLVLYHYGFSSDDKPQVRSTNSATRGAVISYFALAPPRSTAFLPLLSFGTFVPSYEVTEVQPCGMYGRKEYVHYCEMRSY